MASPAVTPLQRADALSAQGRLPEALALYRALLARSPGALDLSLRVTLTCCKLGRLDEARAALDAGLARHPDDPYLLYNRVILEPWTTAHPCFARLRRSLARVTDVRQQAAAHFALAKLYENSGDYAQAFAAYRAGNACVFALARNGPHFHLRHRPAGVDIDATLQRYTEAFFTARAGWGRSVADPPVLVLGASRSGKSLLANLLGAHPALANLDERRELGEAFTRHGEALLGAATEAAGRAAADGFARAYTQPLAGAAGAGVRGLDTQPFNIPLVGLLAVAVPDARVILVERDEQDLLVANYCCYHQSAGHAYSSNLADCQAFLRNYARLARHWRELAPLPIHSVRYEELVASPDRVVGETLAFLGLDWDEACRANREDDAGFAGLTPGVSLAVRSRIDAGLVGYWRHYAEWLPAAIAADRAAASPGVPR